MSLPRFDPASPFRRLPCGTVESHLSALLDDALSGAARERLSAHVLRCRHCAAALTDLRRARDLLRRSGSATIGPRAGLSQRLLAIGETPAPVPGPVATADLPGPRADRSRAIPVGMAMVLVTLVAVASIGWLSAPTPETSVADPGRKAEGAFAAALAAGPLGSAATAAVVTAPHAHMVTSAGALAATRVGPGSSLNHDQVARLLAATDRGVAHDGVWQVEVRTTDTAISALVRVQARPGQGTQYMVGTADGRQVAASFVPDDDPRLPTDRTALARAGLTARGGQLVAGRHAVVLEATGAHGLVHRWWVDSRNGLLLRTETLMDGVVTTQAGFRELHVGPEPTFLSHLQPRLGPSAASLAMTNSRALSLHTHGWFCREEVAGLSLLAAHSDSVVAPQRLRLTYGDATQQVTVLQEPGTLPDTLAGFVHDPTTGVLVRRGWPTVMAWQSGDRVFVVAGMAPAPVLSDVVAALPHETPASRTPVDRVRAGWARVGGFVFG